MAEAEAFAHPAVAARIAALEAALATAVDQIVVCRPAQCNACGTAPPQRGGKIVGRRQVVDLPPVQPVVVERQRLRVRCRHCGRGACAGRLGSAANLKSAGPRARSAATRAPSCRL